MMIKIVFPVFLMIGLGYLVGKYQKLDTKTLSNLAIYLLTPALIFTKYLQNPVAVGQMLRMLMFGLMLFMALWIVAFTAARLLKMRLLEQQGFILSAVLVNAGNMGLPFVIFAYGDAGMAVGVVFLMINIVITNSLGVFIAAGANSKPIAAFKQILIWPSLHAIAAAIIIQNIGFELPAYIMKPLDMIGESAIPLNIILLGTQLSKTKISSDLPHTLLASAMRLLITPIFAYLITELSGLSGIIQKVLILQTSMPTAVYAAILATKFDARPEFISGVILVTTALSAFTLSGLLYLLN